MGYTKAIGGMVLPMAHLTGEMVREYGIFRKPGNPVLHAASSA